MAWWSAWSEISASATGSRLLLYAEGGKHLERVRRLLSGNGIDPGRIEFVTRQPVSEYFATYNRIDIALDPFPYNGGNDHVRCAVDGLPGS
jgi:predicted O-linked N-acetylglucosamine transferase (SPINDLY family)